MATTYEFVSVTRCRVVRDPFGAGSTPDDFIDIDGSTDIAFDSDADTHCYMVDIDGVDRGLTDWIPAGPPGSTLTDVRPWVTAYVVGTQGAYTGGAIGSFPEPDKKPWLAMNSTEQLIFDEFDSSPAQIVCEAADDLGVGPFWADDLQLGGWFGSVSIHVTAFGYRFTFEGEDVAGAIPPRRIFGRTDGKTHGAPRLFGNR
jgi:hypothetical protein